MGKYISVEEYAITLVALSVLVLVSGIMGILWLMEKNNYSSLLHQYEVLQKKYQSLLTEYRIVTSNSTLYQLYEQSLERYNDLVSAISSAETYGEWSSWLDGPVASVNIEPGGYVFYPIVVPSGCNATVKIAVATDDSDPSVYVYVATLSSMNEATAALKTPSMLYVWRANEWGIDEHITLKSGVYVVTILNPATSQSSTTALVYIGTTLHCG
jgi:hypothetical protein